VIGLSEVLSVCLSFRHTLHLCFSFRFSKNAHNFYVTSDINLMFGMHVYLMELHILSDERSRSSFKVKGQMYFFKRSQKGALCF
jgi:hypothetical protein